MIKYPADEAGDYTEALPSCRVTGMIYSEIFTCGWAKETSKQSQHTDFHIHVATAVGATL